MKAVKSAAVKKDCYKRFYEQYEGVKVKDMVAEVLADYKQFHVLFGKCLKLDGHEGSPLTC
eukprot:CAMPEP_0204566526 /NCGR_PEP_ID=MMETSP0661-20131031/36100_1 /ASSEMBLY_ACC=CAM_ASM_000606 /TAXON_ID=109239 /ORGANISM="Alexandrium margalefi, Strain AMGDE01CS-322" /LENGTH=60 /DNA_ID=CAMNT_0051574381 /DNA_START=102 /DNA_END=285 /DNA_ORIENTATION=-